MQRKKYRDYSHHVELGHSLNFVPVAQMRKFTMNRFLKFLILIVIGYILISVYMKYKIANINLADTAEMFKDKLQVKSEKETDTQKEIDAQKEIDRKVKEQVDKVFEEFRHKQQENERKNIFETNIGDKEIYNEKAEENVENDAGEEEIDEEEEKSKVKVEIIDKIEDAEDAENADFVKLDIDAGAADDKVVDDAIDNTIDKMDKKDEANDKELEIEIEERIAEALKDAVNEVADKRGGLDTGVKKSEEAQQLEDEKIEKEEFKDAARNIQIKLAPDKLEKLRNQLVIKKGKHDDDHEFPPFVTAARQTTYGAALHLIYSIQLMMPGETIHVYDLDLTNEQKKHLMSICNVKVQLFMKKLFPPYVSNLDNLHWKPLVIQTALAEFGHITWINPNWKLATQEFSSVIHDSHDTGILLITQSASYSTYAVTHRSMLSFIPTTNMEKLKQDNHLEIKAMIIHNTPDVHEKFMKLFTACAMEESCLAPRGARWQCSFDFTGRKPANCHRYDESAINILLKNMFDFDYSRFSRPSASMFRMYDKSALTPKLKYCRDVNDKR